jgi:hypothetical protein
MASAAGRATDVDAARAPTSTEARARERRKVADMEEPFGDACER